MKTYLKYSALALVTLLILSLLCMAEFRSEAAANLSGPPRSRGCGQVPPTVPGETGTLSMVFDGLNRTYNVHLPPSYRPNTPHSLALNFHGYGGNADEQENVTSLMSPHADANGYIVVYPQAYPFDDGSGGLVYTWNDVACHGSPGPEGPTCAHSAFDYPNDATCNPAECNYCSCQDDVGFVDAMLDEIENNYCVDAKRVYATGFSTGGMFVQRLGCDLADRFAAIAPVHGFLLKGFNCAPNSTLSTMNVYGTQDRIVPYDGSLSSDGYWYTPLEDVMDAWTSSQSQDCDTSATPYATVSDGVRNWMCTQRANCSTGAQVVSCSWRGPHWWPKTPQSSFGNDAIWEFFGDKSR